MTTLLVSAFVVAVALLLLGGVVLMLSSISADSASDLPHFTRTRSFRITLSVLLFVVASGFPVIIPAQGAWVLSAFFVGVALWFVSRRSSQ